VTGFQISLPFDRKLPSDVRLASDLHVGDDFGGQDIKSASFVSCSVDNENPNFCVDLLIFGHFRSAGGNWARLKKMEHSSAFSLSEQNHVSVTVHDRS
jgi:hypothetical protein